MDPGLVGDDWFTAGVGPKITPEDAEQRPPTYLHGLQIRLVRVAMWLARLAELDAFEPVAGLLAAALARWAARLACCLDALDAHVPGWRNAPGLAE